MQLSKDFYDAVAKVLETKTVYQLSKETGVDQSLISRYLVKTRGITLETASKIAPAIGVSLRQIKK